MIALIHGLIFFFQMFELWSLSILNDVILVLFLRLKNEHWHRMNLLMGIKKSAGIDRILLGIDSR